jgi:hypothetical protein
MLKTSTTVLWMGAAWGLALFGATQAVADPCHETGKCTASDAQFGDRFGDAVALDGDVAVMGTPDGDDYGSQSGSVYIFHYDGAVWAQQPKLIISGANEDDNCGHSVSVSGDSVVFGAPSDEHAGLESGSAYIFRLTAGTWDQEAKLTASDAFFFDVFGESVAIDGNVALVGAHQPLSDGGKVYAFRFNTSEWVEEDILTASDANLEDQFGVSVSVEGNVALIGANHDDEAGDNSGAAYIFQFNSETSLWDEQVKLTASDASPGDGFGISVSLSGNVALIGANNDEPSADDSGSAYVFRYTEGSWVQEDKLTAPPEAPPADDYGRSVSINGDLATVGAHFDSPNGSSEGAAYLYQYQFDGENWVWNLVAKLIASDRDTGDTFGGSVAIDGGTAFIGAAQDGPGGSAYSFEGLEDGIPDGCGCPWDLDGTGDVGVVDFLQLLAAWGSNPGHPADFDGSGQVAVNDFLVLLAHWGPCP